MPLVGIEQPDFIQIDHELRLKKYDGNFMKAYPWYQDDVVRKYSEGVIDPDKRLDVNWVAKKLNGLNGVGELYFIEVLENGQFIAVGDVTLLENNPPIEIGVAEYRGVGIGKKVMIALVERARQIGIKKIYNVGCYEDNIASHKMLLGAGFRLVAHDKERRRLVHEITLF